jgi:uncharacterized protein YjeT (DUF2065 family)
MPATALDAVLGVMQQGELSLHLPCGLPPKWLSARMAARISADFQGAVRAAVKETAMQSTYDSSMCPNCRQRPAEVLVDYDELLALDYRTRTWGARQRQVSWSQTSASGKVLLCRDCAAAYARSTSLRQTGRRFTNIGMALIAIGVVLYFAAVWAIAGLSGSPLQLVPLAPAAIGLVSLLAGFGLEFIGRAAKRSATRFLVAR